MTDKIDEPATTKMLNDIENVVQHHIIQQNQKIIKENNFLRINISKLKEMPLFKKLIEDNEILKKQVLKLKEKLEEYENFANLNLEIKEIERDSTKILKLDSQNWKEIILDNDMNTLGIDEENNEDDEDEDDDEDDEDDDEDDAEDDDEDEANEAEAHWSQWKDEQNDNSNEPISDMEDSQINVEQDIKDEDDAISDEEVENQNL